MDEELVASESELRSLEKRDAEEAAKTPDSHETATCRQNKLKLLVRSHAIREAASPPPDPSRAAEKPVEPTDETSSVQSEAPGERLENECFNESSAASPTETCSAPVQNEATYTDNTGIDLTQFIIETLHRNQKDRTTLLRIEQEMVGLVRDGKRTCHRFPPMSSYHRMLVHRVAAFFGLEHNVDQSGNSVVVSKSCRTRLPEVGFKQYVREDVVLPEEPLRKFGLKREVFSLDDPARSADCRSLRSAHSFEHGNGDRAQAAKCYPPQFAAHPAADGPVLVPSIGFDKSPCACRCCLATCEQHACRQQNQSMLRMHRIQKMESLDATELRSTHQRSFRPAVAKSYSFGGYGTTSYGVPDFAENRAEGSLSVAPQRLHGVKQQSSFSCRLSKQDSNSSSVSISRSSPTSSGYKSQQSQSVSAAPSPTPLAPNRLQSRQPNSWNNSIESQNSGPELFVPGEPAHVPEGVSSLLWAVTSLDAVPPGSVLINPQTGQPFYNPDGTVYRYDPQYSLPSHVETVICSQQGEELRNARPDFTSHREEGERGDLNPYAYNATMAQLPANIPAIEQRAFCQSAQVPAVPFPSSAVYEPSFQNVADERRGGGIECIAVPQGNGYFLYQTSGTMESGPSHLNCMMKSLQLRSDLAGDSRGRCETSANLPNLSIRPGFALQNSLPAGSFPIPAGPGTLLPAGTTAINSNPCLSGVHVHPGNIAPYPAGNQYSNYPPVVYSVPPNAVHSHYGCSQYLLNGYAQHQYNNSQQFISPTFPVIVTQNPPNESLDREKGNAPCGVLPGSYLPLAYRPGENAMIVQSGELDQESRPGHFGIQRQFSLQSPPTCALNSVGNQSLNPGRPSRHNRTPGVGTDAARGQKKGRPTVQQHVKQQPNEKAQNLSN